MLLPLKDENPTRTASVVTVLLIIMNIVIFMYQSYFGEIAEDNPQVQRYFAGHMLDYYVAKYALVPAEITTMENSPVLVGYDQETERGIVYKGREIQPVFSFFSAMFMHGSWLHLLGNMLFLWIFGNNIEDYLGKVRFILFYLVCGVGASIAHIAFNVGSMQPMIGASGAVSGVMGAYLLLFPGARIKTLVLMIIITIIEIPAVIFLGIWFLFQFLYAGNSESGIAWLAHVGGFVVGMIIIKIMKNRIGPPRPHVEVIQ